MTEQRTDAILNALSSLGTAGDKHTYNQPKALPFMHDHHLDAIYEGGRFASVIIDKPPEDCTRHPFEVTTKTDYAPLFQDELERLNARDKFRRAHQLARLMGGAGILMMVDDGLPLDKPLDMRRIKDVTALHVFDRSELVVRDWYRNLSSPHYGEHMIYNLTPGLGATPTTVHASRVLPFYGQRVRRYRQDRFDYWGISITERIWQAVSDLETSTGALATLMHNASFFKLKLKNLMDLLTGPDGNPSNSRLLQRLEAMRLSMSVINALLIDADNEDIENVVSEVKGLVDGYGIFQQNLAFAAQMPLSLLFGNHPKGFSNADESGIQNYKQNIASMQESKYQPNLVRLLDVLSSARLGPSLGQPIPDLNVRFAPVEELSPTTRAEIQAKMSDTAIKLIEQNVITKEEERQRLAQAEVVTQWIIQDDDDERDQAIESLKEVWRQAKAHAQDLEHVPVAGEDLLGEVVVEELPQQQQQVLQFAAAETNTPPEEAAEDLLMQVEDLQAALDLVKSNTDEIDRNKRYTIPEGAVGNAKKVRAWMREHSNFQGGTATGKRRSHQLAQGGDISMQDLIEINAWFARHKGNEKINPDFKDEPWRDAGYTSWLMWGGDTMRTFAREIVEGARQRDDGFTGAMIALYPSMVVEAAAQRFRAPSSKDKPHVTLMVLPDFTDEHHPAVCEILAKVCQGYMPLEMSINGTQILKTPQAWVHALTPTGQGLVALRTQLAQQLDLASLLGPQTYDFIPHMTLGYYPQGVLPPDYAEALSYAWPSWRCDEVCLVRGDEVLARFSLGQQHDPPSAQDNEGRDAWLASLIKTHALPVNVDMLIKRFEAYAQAQPADGALSPETIAAVKLLKDIEQGDLIDRKDIYTGIDDPNLPEHVLKAEPDVRRVWVEVFNSTLKEHPKDEGRAIATANSVAFKQEDQ